MGYYPNGYISYERYLLNDKNHNENGPAIIAYTEEGFEWISAYYLNGVHYTEQYIIDNWIDFCKLQLYI